MFTKIDELMWTDEKFKSLSDDAKFLFIYILSCPHRNMLGFYFLPIPYASFDLNWNDERLSKGLQQLLEKGLIIYNFDTSIVFIKNFLKYNPLDNPNQVKGAIKALKVIPTNGLDKGLLDNIETINRPVLKPLVEQLHKRLTKGYAKQEDVDVEEDVEEDVQPKVDKKTPLIKKNVPYKAIIDYLNEILGTRFRSNSKIAVTNINARVKEGYVLEDFKIVIRKKHKEWINTKWAKYLNPETLFSDKFEKYLNQQEEIVEKLPPAKGTPYGEDYVPNMEKVKRGPKPIDVYESDAI